MKDRERQPENTPERLHTTAQYSLEELLVRTQSGEEEQPERVAPPTQQPPKADSAHTRPLAAEEKTPAAPADQRGEMLEAVQQVFLETPSQTDAGEPDAPLWKKWGGRVKHSKAVRTLRQKVDAVRRDDQPDEMEQIYGDRPMLSPVSEGDGQEGKASPQFGYLFGEDSGEEPGDGDLSSLFERGSKRGEAKEPDSENEKARSQAQTPVSPNSRSGPGKAVPKSVPPMRTKAPSPGKPDAPIVQKPRESTDTPPLNGQASPLPPKKPAVGSLQQLHEEREKRIFHRKPTGEENISNDTGFGSKPEDWTPLARKQGANGRTSSITIGGKEPGKPSRSGKEKHAGKAPDTSKVRQPDGLLDKGEDPSKEKSGLRQPPPRATSDMHAGDKGPSASPEQTSGPGREKAKPEAPPSRYEKLFGKHQPAKSAKAPSQGKNRHKEEHPTKLFTPETTRKPILLDAEEDMKVALQDEYEEYRRTQNKEPVPFEPAPLQKPGKKQTAKSVEKTQRDKFSIFGEVEPDDGTPEEAPRQELPALEDYTHPEDAFSIKAELIDHMRTVIVRTVVTAIAALLSIAAVLLFCVDLSFNQALRENAYWYLGTNLALLGVSAGFSYVPMSGGMKVLFRLKGNSDSAIAFAVWIALIHGAVAFFTPQSYLDGGLSIYGCLATLGLFLNSWGKLTLVRRVYANFKFVSSPEKKHAVKIVSDEKLADKLCRGMGLEKSIVAYQRPVGFLNNFLRLSYEPDPSEKLAGKIAPVGALASLAVGAGACLITQNIQSALAAMSISACVSVPMCCVPAVNLPIRGLCKRALRMGAMLVGYPGVRQFADTNAVVLQAGQLYPGKSVVLHGMKGFGGERIDQAILEAGAVMTKAGAPMAATFQEIIQGKGELLPKVDSVSYEDDMGVVGWVGGRRVLVGNRKLLEEHGVTPPEQSVEDQYRENGRQITYLATAGELKALFVTSYIPDEKMKAQMQKLEAQGVCFLIRTCDPNITARTVSDHFQVYYRSVRVLPEDLSSLFEGTPEQEKETARAYLATKGRATVTQRMVISCIRVRNKVTLSLLLQAIAVILGFLLVAFLIFASGLGQLGALEMLIYTLFWVLAILIVPSIRRA